MKQLKKRILDISYRRKLSHLSSCFSTLPILYDIYEYEKQDDEVFVLSNGHSGLALYVILEHYYGIDAEMLLEKHGIHPSRDVKNKIFCSTGSLGSGLPISIGHALANKSKMSYCLISDGECAEGSIWESLRFITEKKVDNLRVYVNVNGYSATEKVDVEYLTNRLNSFMPAIRIYKADHYELDFLDGVSGHYHVMDEKDYEKALCKIN